MYYTISNANTTQGTRIMNPNITGNSPVQHNDISWSYRNGGNEALQFLKKNGLYLIIYDY